jgi:LemA protein
MNRHISSQLKRLYGPELGGPPRNGGDVLSGWLKTLGGPGSTRPSQNGEGRRLQLKFRTVVRAALAALLVLQLAAVHFFCKFVRMQQNIYLASSRIEVEYQRRENIIPRLAEIARLYAQHERGLMDYVSDARALQKASPKLMSALGPAKAAQVERVFTKLIALAEQYPNLKADQSYQALMAKNVTTENRIAKAREEYADLINKYNQTVLQVPGVFFAKPLRFAPMAVYNPDKEPMPLRDHKLYYIY